MSKPVELQLQRSELIQTLIRQGIQSSVVLDAIQRVPREKFVPEKLKTHAYDNHALAIGNEQTISQPYIVALMTQALELNDSCRVLEIGTGSGYQCAVLAELAHSVFTIERIPALAEQAKALLTELHYNNVRYRIDDGSTGWPQAAPFDRIIVTAAAPDSPVALLKQLANGGILVAPVGSEERQKLIAYRREESTIHRQPLCECRFVPLIGEQGWKAQTTALDSEDGKVGK